MFLIRRRINMQGSRPRSVTLRDVAAKAGVSDATVSAVFSGSRANNVRVSEATRQRVLQVVSELGYQPNGTARALRRQSTNVIGYYGGPAFALRADHPVSAGMLGGIQDGCMDTRRNLLLYGGFAGRSSDEIFTELARSQIDGLVVMSVAEDPVIERLRSFKMPMIAMVDPLDGIPSAVTDDAGGVRELVQYLASKGHRRLSFCTVSGPGASLSRRERAFRDATALHEIESTVLPPVTYSFSESRYVAPVSTFDWLGVPRDRRSTAVVCAYDEIAGVFLERCHEMQIDVPDDLAITGFDGVVRSQGKNPVLTTVRAGWEQVARNAVGLLDKLIRGDDIPSETILPVQILVGETA
jgi:DNA-binding LacI/PurR family transcriptional regulator